LILEFAEHLGVQLSSEFCNPVFAALATDTGWFRFGSTTAYTYRCAATLVKHGAEPATIYGNLYEQETLARIQLRGRILARTVGELGGKLVHTYCKQSDFAETGAHAADTEDVINLTLAVAGTQAAVIFVELKDGAYKVSFRSRTPQVDCSKLAGLFSGGGHKAAAGATIHAPFEQVQQQVLDAVRMAMR
jgi:phosphoesterase RecJ-like protein